MNKSYLSDTRVAKTSAIIAACGLALALAATVSGCGSTPQPGVDEGPDGILDVPIISDIDPDQNVRDDGPGDVAPDVTETGTDLIAEIPTEIPEDNEPPTVVATYPADEESGVVVPFQIRITFSEDINYALTVNANTFKVFDINDEEVDGTAGYDPVSFTLTFDPDQSVIINKAAPYRVWLSNLIQDMHGNRMAEYTFRFATEGFPQMDVYLPIVTKYAPVLYQSTTQAAPQWDYPTTFNFDGDWSATNNLESYGSVTAVPPAVYYDVIETTTHFFIRYAYYYVKHTETDSDFGNEVAGAMVVVQKNPEKPIAVETYFGAMSKEDVRSFVTSESGLVTDRNSNSNLLDDRKYYGVNWVFPESELFPNGHFQNYLTTNTHESCAWIQTNKENAMDFRCDLKEYTKPNLKIVHFAYKGGAAADVTAPFPYSNAEGNEIGYALKVIMDEWWIRRDRTADDEVFSSLIRFEAPDSLPGNNVALPRSFQNSISESVPGGRPIFSWGWNPTVPDPDFYFREFPEGTIFLHPAYYFALRHRITLTDGNTGFSGKYCFNPYLLIDQRGLSADCTPLQ